MAYKHYEDRVKERAFSLFKEGRTYEEISKQLAEEFKLPEGPDVKTIGRWKNPTKQPIRPPDSQPPIKQRRPLGEWLACREGDHDWKYTSPYDRTPSHDDWKPYTLSPVRKCRFCGQEEELESYEVSARAVHTGL